MLTNKVADEEIKEDASANNLNLNEKDKLNKSQEDLMNEELVEQDNDEIISNEPKHDKSKSNKNKNDKIQEEEDDDDDEADLKDSNYEVTISQNHSTIIDNLDLTKHELPNDLSHVSIVTIDDNGKEVVIKTDNEEMNDQNEVGEINFQNEKSQKEVSLVRNENYQNDIIVVNNEYMPQSEQISDTHEQLVNNNVRNYNQESISQVETDDQLSVQTTSSDSSYIENGKSSGIKVNVNLISNSEQNLTDELNTKIDKTKDESKTRVDQVPLQTDLDDKQLQNTPNGVPTSSLNTKQHASSLKRELSDTGSFASFYSASSETDNKIQDEKQQIILRKKKEKV